MNIFEIENFFANSSFFFLFMSMISYWVQIAFNVKKWNIGKISMLVANFCLLTLLILRWKESGHFPLSNLYESLMFLAWSLSTFHLILEKIESGTNSAEKLSKKQFFVGAFTSPTALFINAFATFRLPLEMQQSSPLVPALQSNWLMMHVTVMILSYSALICGSLLSIAFLIVTKNLEFDLNSEKNEVHEDPVLPPPGLCPSPASSPPLASQGEQSGSAKLGRSGPHTLLRSPAKLGVGSGADPKNIQVPSIAGSQPSFPILSSTELTSATFPAIAFNETFNFSNSQSQPKQNGIEMKKKFAENLDNLSYRIIGIGFPLLTIGILSGAVWANEAWGSYWSWDPKETWALATWLVFAIYLHLHISKGWRGKKPAVLASVGFVTIWICFLGVNLLGEGLHSYGFLKNSF